MRVSITYDVVTRESAQDGDTADNGYIHPATEARRSLSNGRNRDIERNMRLARAGKFDFPSLRAALSFISARNCSHHESCWVAEDTMSIYTGSEYSEGYEETFRGSVVAGVSYALHISGASHGTLERLARLLANTSLQSERVSFANRRDLRVTHKVGEQMIREQEQRTGETPGCDHGFGMGCGWELVPVREHAGKEG
jgi:hypothetical protein